MSIVIIEGFDALLQADIPKLTGWVYSEPAGTSPTTQMSMAGTDGFLAVRQSPTPSAQPFRLLAQLPAAQTIAVVGVEWSGANGGNYGGAFANKSAGIAAFQGPAAAAIGDVVILDQDAGNVLSIRVNGTVVATSVIPLPVLPGRPYIETVWDLAGSVNVYVDGVLNVTYAGAVSNGQATIDRAGIGWGAATPNISGSSTYDSVYVSTTATRYGPCKVATRFPDTATASVFTPSSGSDNAAMVAEHYQDGSTTYNYSATPGAIDRFTSGNVMPSGIQAIHAVQVDAWASKDTSFGNTFRPLLSSDGNDVVPAATALVQNDYRRFSVLSQLNPDGSIAWDSAAVVATEMGYELVT